MRISDWSSDVCSSDLLGLGKDAQLPLKKQTEKDEEGKKVPTGKLVFRTKSQYAPVIADVTGKPIPEKQLKSLKIGAGSEGLIQGYFSDYVMTVKERVDGEMVTSEVPGLSFTLTGVEIIKLVKGGGGAEFGAYEGDRKSTRLNSSH